MVQAALVKSRRDKGLQGLARCFCGSKAGMVLFLPNIRRKRYDTLLLITSKIVKPKRVQMKKLTFFATTLLAAWMLQACNGGSNTAKHEDAVDSAQAVNKETAPVDKESSDFAVEAANGGMMEVQLGKLAQEKATNQRVKDFAAMMVRDHSKANDELKGLAQSKNIALPDSVSGDARDHMDKMSKMSGKDFDKHYIDMMVDDHDKDVDKFDKAANNLSDPDLKTWAGNTLPTLRAHQDSAKAIQAIIKK